MKKNIYLLLTSLLLLISLTSIYILNSTNNKLKNMTNENIALTKESKKIKNELDSKTKDIEKIKKDLANTKNELDTSKKALDTLESNREVNYDNPNSNYTTPKTSSTNEVPNTEYKLPNEDDLKDMAEKNKNETTDIEIKSDEPQYATYTQDNLQQFMNDNGMFVGQFEELNPGVTAKQGKMYRIE